MYFDCYLLSTIPNNEPPQGEVVQSSPSIWHNWRNILCAPLYNLRGLHLALHKSKFWLAWEKVAKQGCCLHIVFNWIYLQIHVFMIVQSRWGLGSLRRNHGLCMRDELTLGIWISHCKSLFWCIPWPFFSCLKLFVGFGAYQSGSYRIQVCWPGNFVIFCNVVT